MIRPTVAAARVYFFVVVWFTLWVGGWGFFRPEGILHALPWPVPPLHARFVGAIYLGATTFLILSLLSRSLLATRTVARIAFWWTGWLLMVTFLHWDAFDFARTQTWFWVVAYIAFPIVAAWLAWGAPTAPPPEADLIRERWIPAVLRGVGVVLVVVALAFFAFPARVGDVWPWKISPFLAQIYSGPLLGIGVGCWTLAARRNWTETCFPMAGLLVAAVFSIVGSLFHLALFTPGSPSLYVWFATLTLLSLFAGYLTTKALRAQRG
jgi:hypothetical protein